jgi:hypothetical protein
MGTVSQRNFLDTTMAFLLQKSVQNVVPLIQQQEAKRLAADPTLNRGSTSVLTTLKEKDLQEFKDILM